MYINELPHKTNSLETDLKIKRYIVKILTNSLLKVASYKGINIINIVKQKTMYEVLKYNNLIVSCASIEKCKELINEYMYSVPEDETKDFIVRRRLEYKSIDGLHCASEYLITNEEKFNEWLKEHYNIIHDYFRKKEKELQKPIYAAPKYRSENKSKKSDGIKGIDYVSFSDLSKNIYEYYDVPDFSYSDYKKLLIQNNFIYLDENGKNVPTEDAINKGYIYEFQKTTNVIKFSRKGMSAVLDIFGKYIASISGFSQAEKILNQ